MSSAATLQLADPCISAVLATTGGAGDVAFFDVRFCLYRIDAQVTWTLSRQGVLAFRTAIATGELGPAQIISVEQRAALAEP